MSSSLAALCYSLQGMLRIATFMAWSIGRANYMYVHVKRRTKLLLTFLKYFEIWVQIWSCLSIFILFITRDREVMSSPNVFVCLFGMMFVPTIWIRWNDTAQSIVSSYIGGNVLFCLLCAMHSWRHWWRQPFKKLNNFLSTSVGINTVIICGSRNIFLAQSSFGFGQKARQRSKIETVFGNYQNTYYAHGSFNLTSDMEAKWSIM